jgi:hypothetical protein
LWWHPVLRKVDSSSSTSGTRRIKLGAISHEWRNDREVFTINGTYPWLFVTQKFHNGQPSPHTFPNTKFSKETQLVRTDYRLDIKCFEIHKSNIFWTFITIIGTSHHSHCNHECSKNIFNLIIITLHRNNPWDVRKFTQGWKCSKWSPFPW